MNAPLAAQSCSALPQGSPPLLQGELAGLLSEVPAWHVKGGRLAREFRFADYHRTIAFVNAVAGIAHQQDHHPDLAVGYDRCRVEWHTHSVGGLSLNDFICAARVDALAP